jgi:hypothetical protein
MPGASIRSGHGLAAYIRAMVRQRLTSTLAPIQAKRFATCNPEGISAMPDLHSLPVGTRPTNAIRNNGPDDLVLERFKLRELAEGWPMYRCVVRRSCLLLTLISPFGRDAREWENFRSIFHPGAFIYTTWTGRISVEDFVKVSQDGMDDGAFIMHRVHGSSVDLGERLYYPSALILWTLKVCDSRHTSGRQDESDDNTTI